MTEIAAENSQRIDTWLWCARFCKSRSLAAELAAGGRMRCAGTIVTKPHHAVRVGDVLTFPLGRHIRVVQVLSLAERRGPAPEAQGLYQDLAPPSPETALPKSGGLGVPLAALALLLTTFALMTGATMTASASAREIAADAWFQRDLDANMALCAVRGPRPAWCPTWILAMETARPKLLDVTLPEWRRTPFGDSMMVCATLLPPDWCPAWHDAMAELSRDSAYTDLATGLANQRIREEDARQAKIDLWQHALNHVATNQITPQDMDLIRRHAADGDAVAMEALGWMFAQGQGVRRDYARAYEFYGRAVLAGRNDLRPTLSALWPMLNETQKNEARSLFK